MKIEEGHVKVDNRMCLFHSREKVRRGGKGGFVRELLREDLEMFNIL